MGRERGHACLLRTPGRSAPGEVADVLDIEDPCAHVCVARRSVVEGRFSTGVGRWPMFSQLPYTPAAAGDVVGLWCAGGLHSLFVGCRVKVDVDMAGASVQHRVITPLASCW